MARHLQQDLNETRRFNRTIVKNVRAVERRPSNSGKVFVFFARPCGKHGFMTRIGALIYLGSIKQTRFDTTIEKSTLRVELGVKLDIGSGRSQWSLLLGKNSAFVEVVDTA